MADAGDYNAKIASITCQVSFVRNCGFDEVSMIP